MSDFFQMMFQGAAGAGGAGLNVEEVYSTYVYTGNNDGAGAEETQTITNGIDLSGEGGLVWLKKRSSTGGNDQHFWYDTERGATKRLLSNSSIAEGTSSGGLTQFNSDGFLLGGETNNYINDDYVSWTFRKAPKFFDVQTWTGDSGTARAIPHNLGSVPGMIVVKRRNSSEDWPVWHKDINSGSTKVLYLNQTTGISTSSSIFASTQPTSTHFYVGDHPASNNSGDTYVAYIFAHNNGDGEFGPTSDQDIIKCGYYYGNGSAANGPSINLGFEPQWVFMKNSDQPFDNWILVDYLRGIGGQGSTLYDDYGLNPNSSASESPNNIMTLTPNGFKITSSASRYTGNGNTMIYVAIRKGPMADIEDSSDVFAIDNKTGTSDQFYAPWPADFAILKNNVDDIGNVAPWIWTTRHMNDRYVSSNNNSNQSTNNFRWDESNYGLSAGDTINDPSDYCWMWREKEGFFDSLIYIGDRFASGGNTVTHGLGVVPEMIICKGLEDTGNWGMYHSALGATKAIEINNSTTPQTGAGFWNNTAPTSTTFTLGTNSHTNGTGYKHVALLFASVPGVCKIGSYTGTGSDQNIDCGFSNGAKLVMLVNTDVAEEILFFDSERGIISGNSPYLQLGSTAYQFSSQNYLSPYSSGFTVPGSSNSNNSSGDTFIYYAIAAP